MDNFAARLDARTCAITAKLNQAVSEDTARYRRKLVVRGYSNSEELEAFHFLLKNPNDTNYDGRQQSLFRPPGHWKKHLSVTFWLLIALGSPCVRALHPDDAEAVHDLRGLILSRPEYEKLRRLATGDITWEESQKGEGAPQTMVDSLMRELVRHVDMLCVTAGSSEKWSAWIMGKARAVAVDEGANMGIADLAQVWGNTLLPCVVFGDRKQLPPTVMTDNNKDEAGNYFNRFAKHGKISALQFLEASGLPVYRLKTQLRMAKGMFDLMAKVIYPDVPFEYADGCSIDLPEFKIGRDLEAFVQERHPHVKPPPAGELGPLFVNCIGSRVSVDRATCSKYSRDQVKIALDFVLAFVQAKEADPAKIVVIAPYAANVELIRRMKKQGPYSPMLDNMPEPSTVDSFQGQENDIAVVVMGTAYPKPGPGFTSNEQRLNVMLTRHRSGLVIVGDINAAGPVEKAGKGKGKGKEEKFVVMGPDGHTSFVKVIALRKVHLALHRSGRVIDIKASEGKRARVEAAASGAQAK